MLSVHVIGRLGAAAEIKSANGREFLTFRVAHNERYMRADGTTVDNTVWVDCVMASGFHNLVKYLTVGTSVYVMGALSLRIYSSKAERCMKAGAQVSVQRLELLSTQSAAVPAELFDVEGVAHPVQTYYLAQGAVSCELRSSRGAIFDVDKDGWVFPRRQEFVTKNQQQPADETNTNEYQGF